MLLFKTSEYRDTVESFKALSCIRLYSVSNGSRLKDAICVYVSARAHSDGNVFFFTKKMFVQPINKKMFVPLPPMFVRNTGCCTGTEQTDLLST